MATCCSPRILKGRSCNGNVIAVNELQLVLQYACDTNTSRDVEQIRTSIASRLPYRDVVAMSFPYCSSIACLRAVALIPTGEM